MTIKKLFTKNQVLTIPNLLTMVRFLLIPFIINSYIFKEDFKLSAWLIIISGLTDIVDGFIARRFNMVSDLGKIIDPMADKLTQAAIIYCLFNRFPMMIFVFLILVIFELTKAISGYLVIKFTNKVIGAQWHGKLNTVCIYLMSLILITFHSLSNSAAEAIILTCCCTMSMSFILYLVDNVRIIRKNRK